MDAPLLPNDGSLRANGQALAAIDTPFPIQKQLRPGIATFRIVAPPAGKGTTLEEDGGPDARPIVHGVMTNVEYQPCGRRDGRREEVRAVGSETHRGGICFIISNIF
jgi:hypothetical protein